LTKLAHSGHVKVLNALWRSEGNHGLVGETGCGKSQCSTPLRQSVVHTA